MIIVPFIILLLMHIWVITTLLLLWIVLLWAFLYMSFDAQLCAFHFWMELLDSQYKHICLTRYFEPVSKVVVRLSLLTLVYEDSSDSISLPILILDIFIFTVLVSFSKIWDSNLHFPDNKWSWAGSHAYWSFGNFCLWSTCSDFCPLSIDIMIVSFIEL